VERSASTSTYGIENGFSSFGIKYARPLVVGGTRALQAPEGQLGFVVRACVDPFREKPAADDADRCRRLSIFAWAKPISTGSVRTPARKARVT
jgi:hypothetical protein